MDGVGREVFGSSDGCELGGLDALAGENLEGNVPARALLVEAWLTGGSVTGMLKSGKLSPFGDSGMVSRSGVELPLVGGPHTWGARPSCAWISRAL